jgi:uncharacterized protein YecE (DUF72 family)
VIYIGTSGWQYDDWRRRFYPADLPKERWLAYLSERFATVEVNNSFYRLPEAGTFARWRRESRGRFVVAVKASRFITHVKRLRDCEDPVKLFWSRAKNLGPKLGPVLFQLPPRFEADPERLEDFLKVLPRSMRAAFEFRDPSWAGEEINGILHRRGAALVLADRPGARPPDVVTGGWSYVRFHQGSRSGPGYSRAKLRRWAERISEMRARDVYVYFNNDSGAAAVKDAQTLTELLAGRRKRVARASERGHGPG